MAGIAGSDKERLHCSGGDGATRAVAVGVILAVALAVRIVYAVGLPLNGDERDHLREARRISLRADDFYLPLDSPVSNHPLGMIYLTAAANWAGGGSLLAVRLAPVGLSLVGLVGLYLLAASLFGPRVALVALALAAVDRHLVASAGVFLESPAVVALAPWAILLMRRCVLRGAASDWLLLGFVFGLGYWISTVFLVLLLPFGLYVLLSGRLLELLKSPWMFAGLAVMVLLMSPPLVVDFTTGGPNYDRNVSKVGEIGLSPRGLLLYLGDLMICFRDPFWIVENIGRGMYAPMYVPCNWGMGVVYLGLAAASLRFWRDERVRLLLLVMAGVMVPVTLLDARELWNEFTWASSTLFAAIPLSAMMIERMGRDRWGRVAGSCILVYAAVSTLFFLVGPKWGYFCPDWQRAYIGRHVAINFRSRWNAEKYPTHEALEEMRTLAVQATNRHPDCAVAWFFLGERARSAAEQREAFQRALELDPDNRLVLEAWAKDFMAVGNWPAAKELLDRLFARGDASAKVSLMLSEAEYRLGNYASAGAQAQRAAAMKPEGSQAYRALYLACNALGEKAEAEGALELYLANHVKGPAAACLDLAEEFFDQGRTDKGRKFLEAAVDAGPKGADAHMVVGLLFLTKLNEVDRAVEHVRTAVELSPMDPDGHYNLGYVLEAGGDLEAIECYRRTLRLSPAHGKAHARLGLLLVRHGRREEAKEHLEAAQRLGVAIPSPGEGPGEKQRPAAPGP